MADLISFQVGRIDDANNWRTVSTGTGAVQRDITASTTSTTSYVYSSTFTGTNGDVVDGVLIHCNRTIATGTFSVALSDNNGTTATREVTVNVTNLPSGPSWVFFRFGSTLTLDGGTDYRVGIRSSVSGSVTVFRNATAANWARFLRRTTTATAAATDVLFICDEWTAANTKNDVGQITFATNLSGTTYGEINVAAGGMLIADYTAGVFLKLKLGGNLNVWGDGYFEIGNETDRIGSLGAELEFVCSSNVQFGLEVRNGGGCYLYGDARTPGKNVVACKLSANATANATSLTVDTDTGWLDNDELAVASTSNVATETERGRLNGNATATTLTVDSFAGTGGGVQFAHSGTAPIQAEIINLTRNVKVYGTSGTLQSYIHVDQGGTFLCEWVEFFWLGSNTTNKRGISLRPLSIGTASLQYCVMRDFLVSGSIGIEMSVASTVVVESNLNVFYNIGTAGTGGSAVLTSSNGVYYVTNCIAMRTSGPAFNFLSGNLTNSQLSNLTAVGGTTTNATGIAISGGSDVGTNTLAPTIDGITIHSMPRNGFTIANTCNWTIKNITVYRCNADNDPSGAGIALQSATADNIAFENVTLFGNRQQNILISSGGGRFTFKNCTLSGDTTYSTTYGINTNSAFTLVEVSDSTFGVATGIRTTHTEDCRFSYGNSFASGEIVFENCLFASSTEIGAQTGMSQRSRIGSQRHDQTAGNHRNWTKWATIRTDSTIFKTAAPSERLTPAQSSPAKQLSGIKKVAIASGTTKTISVWVRKSVTGDGTNYNGNQPRLRYRAAPAAGVTTEGTLDTMTVANGNWEQLLGTSPIITDDAVLEFYVDCDGTAGWINIDDWAVT